MRQVRLTSGGTLAAPLAALALLISGLAAGAPTQSPQNVTAGEMHFTFSDLGAGMISLAGVTSSAGLDFGVRKDEMVTGGTLHLRMVYSPSLIQDLSHLRVSLNGQVLGALELTKADAGHPVERTLALDPRYLSDYNHLQLDLIAHYTTGCEDPQHSSLWLKIGGDSELALSVRRLELRDDLALLPAPFFDSHDNRRLVLPIVLPANASRGVVRSAGVAASWFGVLADYRGARFPVSFDALPASHALVFATNDSRPAGLALPSVEKPTVSIIDHPQDPSVKLLVFQGKDEQQLRQAVEGVALGNAVLTGSTATVERVSYERRAAYDAPRWVRGDRPVKLGELVDDAAQLQGQGVMPQAMTVNLRLPPDLFTWNKAGIPLDLHYRYTAPAERDNSVLTVSVNNQLLRSYRLAPESADGAGRQLLVPLLGSDGSRQSRGLFLPAFQLASDNQLQFQFSMDFHREAECKEAFIDNTREAIDPDSSIDISGFAHYVALPDLALFANAGFPFTRYADLSETGVVLPDPHDAASLEELFFLLGRMGRQTGAVALAYRLLDTKEALAAHDVDLLVLGGGGAGNELLRQWDASLPLALSREARDFRLLAPALHPGVSPAPGAGAPSGPEPQVSAHAGGALAALIGFESPVTSGRSVVALMGTDAAADQAMLGVLGDSGKVSQIRGELALIRDDTVQSFAPDRVYYVGSLSFWQWLWFHFSKHALPFVLIALVLAIAVALFLYGGLQRLAERRLQNRAGK
jgi:cellulose synthase operon protein B